MLGLNNIVEGWSLLTQICTKWQKACVPVSFFNVFIIQYKGRVVRK